MPHELAKVYDPAAIESRWAEFWLKEQLFHADTPAPGESMPPLFDILLPPPNVTGKLHMGHMLEHSEIDICVRWQRMRGRRSLWLPGTDHAGIATQLLVTRQLESEGKDRTALGREKFVKRVWEWKHHYGNAIVEQMKRVGDSVDWSREYFTMDDNLSRAVVEVFVRLHEDGLIYRGRRIVNWCPGCVTAISDLEVIHEDTPGKLYEIKYPVFGSNDFLTVATTRPETMLGDTAVAVNAKDARYTHLYGKKLRLPLASEQRTSLAGEKVSAEIPIILDDIADPAFGSGAVKITPAHDPNDFEAGQRNQLPQVEVLDERARMNQNAGAYAGLDRFAARERGVADLRDQGLLVAIKDHMIPLGHCQRCRSIVEPRLSSQWFVAVNKAPKNGRKAIAQRATEAVSEGHIRVVPDNYRVIYLNWMANIYDWTISRQLWWGHRIPAWHCADCAHITVARSEPAKCEKCGGAKLERDPDVLDTWFSSALLPFTTLGWPDKTRDLDVWYPGSLMIHGFDILFFWSARMIMMGCYFMADHRQSPEAKAAAGFADATNDSVPYRELYIHALVRDAERQKMSKTKGNVLDPVEITERYGTDAVRFALAIKAAPGTDIAFDEKQVEGYRAFANKIWNAARFIFMNVDRAQEAGAWSLSEFKKQAVNGHMAFDATRLEDRWILSRFHRTARNVSDALTEFRFHEATQEVYHFFWDEFCDWYIELAKLRLNAGDSDAAKAATRLALGNIVSIFEGSLRLLAPFMPFLTEELWHAVFDGATPQKSIALASFPEPEDQRIDVATETDMAIVQDLIISVRNIRAELKVEPRTRVPIQVHAPEERVRTLFEQNRAAIERLGNVESIEFSAAPLANQPNSRTTARFEVVVVFQRTVDTAAERERLKKELDRLSGEMSRAQAQLGNQGFLAKAPAKVVDGLRKRAAELGPLIDKTQRALEELRSA